MFCFHWSAFRNHEGSTFTENDRNSLFTEADQITESDQAVQAVHSCVSWFCFVFTTLVTPAHNEVTVDDGMYALSPTYVFSSGDLIY